jgi:hypothetical protein
MEKIKAALWRAPQPVKFNPVLGDCPVKTLKKQEADGLNVDRSLPWDGADLVRSLGIALSGADPVTSEFGDSRIVIMANPQDYERLGELLQKIQRLIDQHAPERKEHLFIVIRDRQNSKENIFKIWKNQDK